MILILLKRAANVEEKLNFAAMETKKYIIIVAGGAGSRMGASQPKQFLEIAGKAILQITIEKFITALPEAKIITVLPQAHIEDWKRYCISHNFICPQTFVAGGLTRFHSVSNALKIVPEGALVAVHDGVRPLISSAHIKALFDLAQTHQAVIPVVPCIDTLKVLKKSAEGLHIIPDFKVDRSILYGAQPTQIFHSTVLKKAYTQPFDSNFTDDASVLEKIKEPLTYAEGERLNIKITTPEDLRLAQAIMSIQ